MSLGLRLTLHASYIIAYTVAALVLGAATALVYPLALWWWPRVDVDSLVLEGFLRGALGFLTYIAWGVALLAVIVVVRHAGRLSVPEGRLPMKSWAVTRFYLYNMLVLLARYFFLPLTRATMINIAFYRAMGARIGVGTLINTAHVYDLNLLEIGDHVTIGGSAVVMAHLGQGNELYTARVVLEDGASVGEMAIVFPGVRIGAGATIGAGSVVPRDFDVPPGTKWSGVPIRRVDTDDEPTSGSSLDS